MQISPLLLAVGYELWKNLWLETVPVFGYSVGAVADYCCYRDQYIQKSFVFDARLDHRMDSPMMICYAFVQKGLL